MKQTFLVRGIAAFALIAVAGGLAGCSQVKKLTGQRDDTVLQGEREPILPPTQTKGQNPDIQRRGQSRTLDQSISQPSQSGTPDLAAPCDPEIDENCIPPSSAEPPAGGSDGIFSDAQ